MRDYREKVAMANLLLILLLLFVALFMVVKITERHGKPLDNQQQSRLSRIIIVLILIMLVGRLLQYFIEG